MLDPERASIRTVLANPALLLAGAPAALAWVALHVVVTVPLLLLTLPKRTQPALVFPAVAVLSVVVLPPLLSGLYVAARVSRSEEAAQGATGTLRRYLGGCLAHGRDLTVATVVFRVAALVPAVVAFVLLLAGDTAVNYWQYMTQSGGSLGPDTGTVELMVVVLYGLAAGAVGRLSLAFYDLPVLFAGVPPRRGWRAALRFSRRRPRALVRYGLGRLLLWSPLGLVTLFGVSVLPAGSLDVPRAALFVVVAPLVGTPVATVLAAHKVVVYDRVVEPVLREPTPTRSGAPAPSDSPVVASPSPSDGGGELVKPVAAVALSVLLVAGLAAGTAAVRVEDHRPMPAAERAVADSMDASAVVHNADRVLRNANYRSVKRSYRTNRTTEGRQLVYESTVAVDRRDRVALITGRVRGDDGQWTRAGYYGSETTLGLNFPGEQSSDRSLGPTEQFAGRVDGEWAVMYYPGYPWVSESTNSVSLDAERPYRVVERTGTRVVVGYTRRPEGTDLVRERLRLVVDRDTGRPLRLVRNETYRQVDNGTVVSRYRTDTVRRFSYRGTGGVDRPDALGEPGPLEWLWDLVYY